MKIQPHVFASALLATLFAYGCASQSSKHGQEETTSLQSAPAAVQESVRRVAGDAKLEKLSKENENGQVIYEAEFEVNGMDHSATINSAGEVLEEEAEIKTSDLPAPVAAAVKGKYPDASVVEANTVKAKGPMMYEVIVESGGTRRELTVTSSGEVTGDKVKHAKAEKDEEHEGHEGNHEKEKD